MLARPDPYPWATAARAAIGRFLSKVEVAPPPAHAPHLGECWLWTGARTKGGGRPKSGLYGSFWVGGTSVRCTVFVCVVEGRMIPGHHPDHLCRNTLCVRPSHLEVVTNTENVLRAHEARGHKVERTD